MINGFEDFQKAGREGMSKALESFGAVSKSWQTLASETAGFSKASFEEGAAHLEKLLGAKSIDVAFEAQTDYPPRLLREGRRPGGALRRALHGPRQGSDEALRGLCPGREEVSLSLSVAFA